MAPRSRELPSSELPDELVEEILLRLPPDEPASLLRASVVCKTWSHAVSSPGFRRRLHELHQAPPVLGFLHHRPAGNLPQFVPTTTSAFSLDAPECRFWRALDCRDGRALFCSESYDDPELLVWEPLTGRECRVPLPAVIESRPAMSRGGAIFCAADRCDHRDCHGTPFRLVFIFCVKNVGYADFLTSVCVYSSETGKWGEPSSLRGYRLTFENYSSVLVRRSLLYFMSRNEMILEYDLAKHGLTILDAMKIDSEMRRVTINLVLAEDGGLRVSQDFYPHLRFWRTREASDGPHAQPWLLTRVINLANLLQIQHVVDDAQVRVVGFVQGANVIFVNTPIGLFTVELLSERVRKVTDDDGFTNLIPVVGFYTPLPRRTRQDQSLSSPSEEGERRS